MKSESVSILGCGWLGLPLAELLVNNGYYVKGSTTRLQKFEHIKAVGAEPYFMEFDPAPSLNNHNGFFNSDYVIINVPARRNYKGKDAYFATQISHISSKIRNKNFKGVIFISSTSIYHEKAITTEESSVSKPEEGNNMAILMAEASIKKLNLPYVILRCGGLMGEDRYLAKYFKDKSVIEDAHLPVNYVHRDDVMAVIHQIISQPTRWNETYNLAAPEHPTKEMVLRQQLQLMGEKLPEFQHNLRMKRKIVSSNKLINTLNYTFRYSNPVTFPFGDQKKETEIIQPL